MLYLKTGQYFKRQPKISMFQPIAFLKRFLESAVPAIFGLNLYLSANFLKNSFNDIIISLQEFFNKFARNLKIYLRKSRNGRLLAKLLGFALGQKFCEKRERNSAAGAE
jgi:hypothetical protein